MENKITRNTNIKIYRNGYVWAFDGEDYNIELPSMRMIGEDLEDFGVPEKDDGRDDDYVIGEIRNLLDENYIDEYIENSNKYIEKFQDRNDYNEYEDLKDSDKVIGNLFKESKVEDSTDAWKVLREYMLSRISMRFDTLEEMEDEVNEKFKSIMEQIQGHYDSWFESELKQNYSVYGIEILGKDEDVIVEDEEELDESQLGKLDEEQPEERGNVEDIDFEEQ